jgi:hypothetical protein
MSSSFLFLFSCFRDTVVTPISSPHYDNDFISLEGEVSTFSSKGKIVLIGDFNSRTGQNPDFIEKDSKL